MAHRARVTAFAALAVAVAGQLLYLPFGRHAPRIVELELAGTAAAVREIAGDERAAYVSAVYGDFLLIPSYVLAIVLAAVAVTAASGRRRWAVAAAAGAVLAGLCDIVENLALLTVLGDDSGDGGDAATRAAQVLAAVKFAVLVYAVPAALTAVILAIRRSRTRSGAGGTAGAASYAAGRYPLAHTVVLSENLVGGEFGAASLRVALNPKVRLAPGGMSAL